MKVVLLGNAGSGKSTLAKALQREGAAHLALDAIAWNAGVERRPFAESIRALIDFIDAHDSWVIEGCYGELVRAALPHCDELRFLNPGVEACLANCRSRPWEPDKYASKSDQDAALTALLEWTAAYETRDDEFGLSYHRELFDAFTGAKQEYRG